MKKGMKKAIAFFMTVTMCITPFTGCGSASDTSVSTDSKPRTESASKTDSKTDASDISNTETDADSDVTTTESDTETGAEVTTESQTVSDSDTSPEKDSETEAASTSETTSTTNEDSKKKSKNKSNSSKSQSKEVIIPLEEVVMDPEPARGEVTYEELQESGVKCKEYPRPADDLVYIKITNDGDYAKYLTITSTFKKGGQVVYETETYWDVAANAYCIADIYSEEDFDSVEHTYVEEDAEFRAYATKELDVTCEVDTKEGMLSGTIINQGEYTIEYPEIHFVFYDKDKNIIGHTVVSADATELNPSDSSPFESSFPFEKHDSYEVYASATLKF